MQPRNSVLLIQASIPSGVPVKGFLFALLFLILGGSGHTPVHANLPWQEIPSYCPEPHPCSIVSLPVHENPRWISLIEAATDKPAPTGFYQIWKSPPPAGIDSPENSDWVLLRDGTEVARIAPSTWGTLCMEHATVDDAICGNPYPMVAADSPTEGFWTRNRPLLIRYGQWDRGVAFTAGSSINALPGYAPEFERHFGIDWLQEIYPLLWLGAGAHWGHYGGGLTRFQRGDDFDDNQSWWSHHWWWSATAGIPGLRYRLQHSQRPHPEFFWLQPAPRKVLMIPEEGGNSLPPLSAEPPAAFGHSILLRMGMLGYGFYTEQSPGYRPLHRMELRDLPLGEGRWAMGMFHTSGRWIPFLRAELLPVALDFPLQDDDALRFKGTMLRFDFHYLSKHQMHVGLALSVAVDHPRLRRPLGGINGR